MRVTTRCAAAAGGQAEHRPDVIIFNVGLHEAGASGSAAEIEAHLRHYVLHAKSTGAELFWLATVRALRGG